MKKIFSTVQVISPANNEECFAQSVLSLDFAKGDFQGQVVDFFRANFAQIKSSTHIVMPGQAFAGTVLYALIRMGASHLKMLFPAKVAGEQALIEFDLAKHVGEESPVRKLRQTIVVGGKNAVGVFNGGHPLSFSTEMSVRDIKVADVKLDKGADMLIVESAEKLVQMINSEGLVWDGVQSNYNPATLAPQAIFELVAIERLTGQLPVVWSVRAAGQGLPFELAETCDLQAMRQVGSQVLAQFLEGNAPVAMPRELFEKVRTFLAAGGDSTDGWLLAVEMAALV